MSEEEADSGSDSSSSDEEEIVDLTSDRDFFKTLSCLKNKDPRIYDKDVQFYTIREDDGEVKDEKPKVKPMYLRDYEREIIVKGGPEQLEEDQPEVLPYVQEQKEIRESLQAALHDDGDDDLLKVKEKTQVEKEQEEEEYLLWLKGQKEEIADKDAVNELKPLHDYWNNPNLDENELFLKEYILKKSYLADEPKPEELLVEKELLDQDEEDLKAQAEFETAYNFRFETGDEVKDPKRYPRGVVQGSVRKKDDSRKKKREQIKERRRAEKEKKRQEIHKNKKLKINTIKEKLEEIKRLTNNPQLGFKDEEILEDFDPVKHDEMMKNMFNDDFYNNADDNDDVLNAAYCDDDDGNIDLEAGPSTSKKETRSKKKRKGKKKAFTEIEALPKPVYDPEVHSDFQKYMDEYYQLDCEDFIDDIPCRFKYRQVVPNSYGLSVEEILAADDAELDKWASSKKMFKLRPQHVEKNEVKIYKEKGADPQLKTKILTSLYKDESEKGSEEAVGVKNKRKRRRPFKHVEGPVSDARLAAFDIKPKQFRKKLHQHKKRKVDT